MLTHTRVLFCSLVLMALFFTGCTENNIFDNEVEITENRLVRGRVQLSDQIPADSVYVWMEGLNLYTYTDENGNFSIEIPSPANQPGSGLTGVFNIYYFLGNYGLKSSSTLILDGQFEYGKGDLDVNGNLRQTVQLQKLLDMETVIEPDQIQSTYKDSIVIRITLRNLVDSVRVRTFKHITGQTSCLVIQPVGGTRDESVLLRGSQTFYFEEVITEKTEWLMIYKFIAGFFVEGHYSFMPYLEIVQDDMPPELLESLGENVYGFTLDYLNIPYKQDAAILTVENL